MKLGKKLAAIAFAVAACGGPCPAAPADDARAFVEGLYANYKSASFCPTCDGRERFFDASLSRLLEADAKQADGEVGAFDGDPVCQCQDADGMTAKVVSIALAPPKSAVAKVELRFVHARPAETRHVTFDLALEGGRWRIHDVHSADTPSLRALLAK